jgi:hypothetical protein
VACLLELFADPAELDPLSINDLMRRCLAE